MVGQMVGLKGGSADNQTGEWTDGRMDEQMDVWTLAVVRPWRSDRDAPIASLWIGGRSRSRRASLQTVRRGAGRRAGTGPRPPFMSFKRSRLRQWYLGKVSTCLEFTQRYCHAVLLQPMNSGYLRLFDKMINYLSCSIQWQYTVWWLSWFLLISLTLLWINIGWINLTESK